MSGKSPPQMEIIEFFDYVYAKYKRYWYPQLGDDNERYHVVMPNHSGNWAKLLEILRNCPPGLALDLGAGEGTDAIKLALMGYEVDALEGSAIGAEKIQTFARQAKVRVNVIHEDVRKFQPTRQYDVVICSGLLHYIEDKTSVLQKIQRATRVGGYNLVSLFSDYTAVPECHRVIDVFCDAEDGIVKSFYHDWQQHLLLLQRNRLDHSHPGFPSHYHSLIKIVVQRMME
jgi:SAM-dependent methyltransferase